MDEEVFFNMQVFQGEAHHSICIPPSHWNWCLEGQEGVRLVDQSSVLPERSRTDIMESDNLLASLSADGEIQVVTWWLACQQNAHRSWPRATLVYIKLPNWLTYSQDQTTKQLGGGYWQPACNLTGRPICLPVKCSPQYSFYIRVSDSLVSKYFYPFLVSKQQFSFTALNLALLSLPSKLS